MPHQLRILKINLSILTTTTKKKKKTHEFRSNTLFIKNIEEHKPKKIIQTQKIKHKNTRKSNPKKS